MRSITFAAILISTLLVGSAYAEHHRSGQSGVFDYYLLNLSWEPEFCHSARNADSEECRAGGRGFVLHGLWPQYADGYPEHCTNAAGPVNPSRLLDIMPTTWLVQHEWSTHGTCSGLSPDAYFMKMRLAYSSIVMPETLKAPARNMSLSPAAIKQAFIAVNHRLRSEDMAVSCGRNYLTAVEFCLDTKTLGFVTCGKLRDCHANTVRIAPVR